MKIVRLPFIAAAVFALVCGSVQDASARPAEIASQPVLLADEGFGGEALALNDAGLVVGDVLDASGSAQAAIWSHRSLRMIPTVGLVRSTALDVNDHGLVVGQGLDASHNRHGWTFQHGTFRFLQAPFPGGTDVQVRRVNEFGEIIGTASDLDGTYYAVKWASRDSAPVVLAPLSGDGSSFAHGVNDLGTVAGDSDSADGSTGVPVLWSRSGVPSALPWGRGFAEAFAINDHSETTGSGMTGGLDDPATQSHILVWSHGRVRDLGALAGDDDAGSLSINERGIVVGFSASDLTPSDSGNVRAVVWPGNGPLRELPRRATDNYSTAHDINQRNQIAGLVGDPSGLAYAALWQLRRS